MGLSLPSRLPGFSPSFTPCIKSKDVMVSKSLWKGRPGPEPLDLCSKVPREFCVRASGRVLGRGSRSGPQTQPGEPEKPKSSGALGAALRWRMAGRGMDRTFQNGPRFEKDKRKKGAFTGWRGQTQPDSSWVHHLCVPCHFSKFSFSSQVRATKAETESTG